MIPLHDTIPSRRVPFVTYALMAASGLGWALELSVGPDLERLVHDFGLIPARALALRERVGLWAPSLWLPFLTSMFLHAGWMHVGGNMLYLWIFGDNVEDRLGPGRYLLFYLAGGVLAGAAHVASNPDSVVPTVGASGAIAAVMGGYFLLYPRARIVSLVIVIFWIEIIQIPAYVYLALWFVIQLLSGTAALAATDATEGGVAWWAHAGGFVFGMAAVHFLTPGAARKGRKPA